MQLVQYVQTNHTAKATFKCSTSENKFPWKQIPDIEIPAHQYKTVCIHQWKYENKFQSQSNHDSFNCRPSKSNPHSINQKSVIFGMHKNTSSECLQHKCHIAPQEWLSSHLYFHKDAMVAERLFGMSSNAGELSQSSAWAACYGFPQIRLGGIPSTSAMRFLGFGTMDVEWRVKV